MIQGIFSLALTLFCDHESHFAGEIGKSWPNIIKDEDNHYISYPLFIPPCSFGCCGGRDFSVFIREGKVKIVAYEKWIKIEGKVKILDLEVEIKNNRKFSMEKEEFFVSPDHYVGMIFGCFEEMFKLANRNRSYWIPFWFLAFLVSRAALEGKEEIRKPLISRLAQFEKENNVCMEPAVMNIEYELDRWPSND